MTHRSDIALEQVEIGVLLQSGGEPKVIHVPGEGFDLGEACQLGVLSLDLVLHRRTRDSPYRSCLRTTGISRNRPYLYRRSFPQIALLAAYSSLRQSIGS